MNREHLSIEVTRIYMNLCLMEETVTDMKKEMEQIHSPGTIEYKEEGVIARDILISLKRISDGMYKIQQEQVGLRNHINKIRK